jgi:hypothetical protein
MSLENTVLNYINNDWDKLYLSPQLLSTQYEYKLIADKHSFGLYTIPIFSKKFCKELLEELKKFDNWTINRHRNYPTNDVLIQDFNEDFANLYNTIIKNIGVDAVNKLFDANVNKEKIIHESFIVRYNPEIQGALKLHHDASSFTLLTTLSSKEDYEGGGTYFTEHNCLIKGNQGDMTIHPGNLTHKHGARPIISGERYVIVSFCKIKYY